MNRSSGETQGISPRLKQALVADLVMDDLTQASDHWLVEPLREEDDWTEHLARQLGIRDTSGSADMHSTLLLIVRELDELIRTWPPPRDGAAWKDLAHDATKHLTPIEVYATLLAGPASWRSQTVPVGCKVDRLHLHLQPALEKVLTAELSRMVGDWVKWDIRKLRERRDAARAEQVTQDAREVTPRVPPRRRPDYDPNRPTQSFQPPGRT